MPRTGRPSKVRRLAALARGLFVSGLLLLLLAGGLAAVAGPIPYVEYARPYLTGGNPGGAAEPVLEVNLSDNASFQPHALTAVAGTTVQFELHNIGQYSHSFTLSSVENLTLNRSWSPAQLYEFFSTNASVNATVAPDTYDNVTLGIAAAWAGGSFEFASVVPYQFQAGMYGFLNVTSSGGGGGVSITDQTATSALSFVPDAIVVNATSFPISVEVKVSNMGTTPHTWTLVAQPDENLTPTGFTSYFQAHPPAVSLSVPSSPGVPVTGNFTLSAKGTYMYLCEAPGHFAAGMFGFLYVGVSAPAVSAPPSTAVVEVWALAGAGGILGIGVALAVAAAFIGRFPPRPPTAGHH